MPASQNLVLTSTRVAAACRWQLRCRFRSKQPWRTLWVLSLIMRPRVGSATLSGTASPSASSTALGSRSAPAPGSYPMSAGSCSTSQYHGSIMADEWMGTYWSRMDLHSLTKLLQVSSAASQTE